MTSSESQASAPGVSCSAMNPFSSLQWRGISELWALFRSFTESNSFFRTWSEGFGSPESDGLLSVPLMIFIDVPVAGLDEI